MARKRPSGNTVPSLEHRPDPNHQLQKNPGNYFLLSKCGSGTCYFFTFSRFVFFKGSNLLLLILAGPEKPKNIRLWLGNFFLDVLLRVRTRPSGI